VKIRGGLPDTAPEAGLWTGELPIVTRAGTPVTQPGAAPGVPASVTAAAAVLGGSAANG
jgi:hypothetical protein